MRRCQSSFRIIGFLCVAFAACDLFGVNAEDPSRNTREATKAIRMRAYKDEADINRLCCEFRFDRALEMRQRTTQFLKENNAPIDFVRASDVSEESIRTVIAQTRENQLKFAQAMSLVVLGDEYASKHDAESALRIRRKVLSLLHDVLGENDGTVFRAYVGVIRLRAALSDACLSVEELKAARTKCKQILGASNLVYHAIVSTEAVIEEHQGNWDKALQLRLEECEILAGLEPGESNHILALTWVGNAQRKLARYPEALRTSTESLKLLEHYKGEKASTAVIVNVSHGTILRASGKVREAKEALLRANDAANVLNDGMIHGSTLAQMQKELAACDDDRKNVEGNEKGPGLIIP